MVGEEILIVNDGSLLLPVIACLLETKGYRLSFTDSPEEALVRLSTRNITLAIVKINGRQVDRLMLMQMVKHLADDNKLIILAEAANPPAAIFEIEADDYIFLPCRMAVIWRRLVFHLQPALRKSRFHQDESPAFVVNRQIFHTLDLMLEEMLDEATSLDRGLKHLKGKFNRRDKGEGGANFQDTPKMPQTLISMTEEFFHRFLYEKVTGPSPDIIDLEPEAIFPVIEKPDKGLTAYHLPHKRHNRVPK